MDTCKFCHEKGEELLIQCVTCKGYNHPSCLELPSKLIPAVQQYDWQCNDCKYCYQCHKIEFEEKILFCDGCDRGYHIFCATPPLKRKPKGDWFCPYCVEARKNETGKITENENVDEMFSDSETLAKVARDSKSLLQSPINSERKSKHCPFPGCDGSGSIKQQRRSHLTLKTCPLYKEQRILEKQMENSRKNDSQSEISPSRRLNSPTSSMGSPPRKRSVKTTTAVDHIVSKSDKEMFEKAKQRMAELNAMEEESRPLSSEINTLSFGGHEMDVWYRSQYPLEYSKQPKLFVCEFCLSYYNADVQYQRHMSKCEMRHPPGNEIYRKDGLSIFELDGETATKYCQNLCLLSKLYLDHKTQWNDIQPFLFYVLTQNDERGCHLVGYFSKEKVSFLNYNVSCILVMPQHMKKGYGKLLIEFSYLLSRVENKIGLPERPLSDLGLVSYRSYWADKLIDYLVEYPDDDITIKGISEKFAIHPTDVVSTLQYLGMIKYWKNQHLILIRQEVIDEYLEKKKQRPNAHLTIDSACLRWTPPVIKK